MFCQAMTSTLDRNMPTNCDNGTYDVRLRGLCGWTTFGFSHLTGAVASANLTFDIYVDPGVKMFQALVGVPTAVCPGVSGV